MSADLRQGAALAILEGWHGAAADLRLTPPPGLCTPDLLGVVYESLLDGSARQRTGAFYTPRALADQLASATLRPLLGQNVVSVCDPAVGGGALLLAVARAMGTRSDPRDLRLGGMDRDPLAVAVASCAIRLVAPSASVSLVAGDALLNESWEACGPGSFDAVVANPPFLSQLSRRTVRTRAEALDAKRRFGRTANGYTDAASLFSVLAVELTRPGGRIGLILPEPILATRDGKACRARVGAATELERLWLAPTQTFGGGVRACVAVMTRRPTVLRSDVGDSTTAEPGLSKPDARWSDGDWSNFAADVAGVPDCDLSSDGLLGDLAVCTADFRDQYYGVAAIAIDDVDPGSPVRPPLITCGLIDPLHNKWGERPARIAKRDFTHPRADLTMSGASESLRRWAAQRLVPKVILATQTSLLEAVADPEGAVLPVVPVISIVPRQVSVWHVAAILSAPPISAVARRRSSGAALSSDSIKMSARQVAELPLPAHHAAWDRGADAARRASEAARLGDGRGWLEAMGGLAEAMCQAYGVDPALVVPWWLPRLGHLVVNRGGGKGQPA